MISLELAQAFNSQLAKMPLKISVSALRLIITFTLGSQWRAEGTKQTATEKKKRKRLHARTHVRRTAKPLDHQLKLNFFAQFRLRGRTWKPAQPVLPNGTSAPPLRLGTFFGLPRRDLIRDPKVAAPKSRRLAPGKIVWLAARQSQGDFASSFCQLHTLVSHMSLHHGSHRILFASMRDYITQSATPYR